MADEWAKAQPAGTANLSDIDTLTQTNNAALDRALAIHRQDCVVRYGSASTVIVGVGSVTCSNADLSLRKFRQNTAEVTVDITTNMDTGTEATSTTYYVWAIADADATTFTCKISLSSTAPTGCTYYRKLASFINNASSDIERVMDDQTLIYFGSWASKTNDTVYQAATDGIVVAIGYTAGNLIGYTDGSNPPTTERVHVYDIENWYRNISFPVRKGDYWKVTGVAGTGSVIYWLPLGSA